MNNSWAELPCTIPGYADLTIKEYTNLIKSCITDNKFNLAFHYFNLAAEYNIVYKMELARNFP